VPVRTPYYPRQAPIDAYGNGGFRFAGMSHRGSLLSLPSGIYAWNAIGIEDLTSAHFAAVLAEKADTALLLLGSGRTLTLPAAGIRSDLEAAGIALEVMDTGAACRTYNVLLAERRPIAAALIAVD
jgi:uncharacterized protein